jgi:hypothetical protein
MASCEGRPAELVPARNFHLFGQAPPLQECRLGGYVEHFRNVYMLKWSQGPLHSLVTQQGK